MILANNNNLKKQENKVKKRRDEDKDKAVKLIIICIVTIVVLLLFREILSSQKNYNNIKEDKSTYIVYQRYLENTNAEVPYINIKWAEIKEINKEIFDFCNSYIRLNTATINYKYTINGNYLSVVINIINEDEIVGPTKIFKTYNINLKTREILTDKDLLAYFNVTEEIVNNKIQEKFLEYYDDEVEEGIININECNFNCYMQYRNLQDNSDIAYYIKNGKLIALKPFRFVSVFVEEQYFTEENFEFQITD